jgi:hypothetical protein
VPSSSQLEIFVEVISNYYLVHVVPVDRSRDTYTRTIISNCNRRTSHPRMNEMTTEIILKVDEVMNSTFSTFHRILIKFDRLSVQNKITSCFELYFFCAGQIDSFGFCFRTDSKSISSTNPRFEMFNANCSLL